MTDIVAERMGRLRAAMQETGTDLVVIGPGSHMDWVVGFHPHPDERPVMLMVSATDAGFLMPALNADAARKSSDLPMFTWADEDGPDSALGSLLAKVLPSGTGHLALDETMRADFALLVIDALPGASREFTGRTIGALRARKDLDEYKRLKASALLNDRAMQAAWAALKPGATEREIANIVKEFFAEHRAQIQFAIIGAGENGAFPHHATGATVLREGDAVVIDIGGRIDGYPSDMTRSAIIGHAPEGYDEVHGVVERAVQAALAAARPGVTAAAVDKAARDVIKAAGYGEYFVHRTGHGLGIDVHEPPYITATSDTVLEEGMVFSIEPGIYLPGRFGVRLEDIVILRADGPEILSELPRDAHVVAC